MFIRFLSISEIKVENFWFTVVKMWKLIFLPFEGVIWKLIKG